MLTLAACGEDGGRRVAVTPISGSGSVVIEARDRAFSAGAIEVAAGTSTTITFENTDDVAHTLRVFAGSEPEDGIAADTGEVAPAGRGEAVVFLSSPGTYAFRCELYPLQMHGSIIVR